MPLTKKQKAVINIAKFLKSQSLYLLGKLEELDLDEQSELCIFRDDLASDFGMSRPPISVSSGH